MAWLANNWIWILVGSAFTAFHLFVHGKHVAADLTVVEGNHRLHLCHPTLLAKIVQTTTFVGRNILNAEAERNDTCHYQFRFVSAQHG